MSETEVNTLATTLWRSHMHEPRHVNPTSLLDYHAPCAVEIGRDASLLKLLNPTIIPGITLIPYSEGTRIVLHAGRVVWDPSSSTVYLFSGEDRMITQWDEQDVRYIRDGTGNLLWENPSLP